MWQKDADMDEITRRLVAAEKCQELLNFHEHLKSTRKLVASRNADIDGVGTIWPHNLRVSTAYVPHLEKVFSNVRQRYGLKLGDKMENLDVNAAFWGMLCLSLFKLQFILGKIMQENLHSIKN